MPYYRAPLERPRQPKRFLTSREVEDMAAAGQSEIVLADDLVITDAARDTAQDLGVSITRASQQPPSVRLAPSAAASPVVPRQLAPPPASAPAGVKAAAPTPGSPDALVGALVAAVRANPTLAGVARKG